ncbi:NAD(P)-binding domain-containing protein [Kaistia dalseonensis]|uniref:Phosphoglycerate dehydrogenase-like enzyme n=1 Tax=Kaistia dalseonensis TaxID=410840 RepID=A0ABU0H421_9HYPH|nr:NAD(P)-dependent oxidoreductase [Kaistia dalseonensis]MCX5494055.1 NAD(P)-binding domain-containing protein [Kaistia dalseonensis]MDQ0436633.1 phosphoglycerate dehydrogenase-like enzyme [Kaistia dalseonensis]
MKDFSVFYTGDYLDEDGRLAIPDIALDHYDGHPSIRVDFLRSQSPKPGDALYQSRLYSLEVTADDITNADAVVIFRPWVKAATFSKGAERLTVIGRAGAGYDKIDLEACTANDVAVFNAPDTLTHATASSAFLLMLALAKRLPEQERMVRNGRWDLQPTTMGIDLPGKTLGIVGLGASGRELARLAAPWGMRIIAYSPSAKAEDALALGVALVPSIDDVFRQADFVSLHNRLDARTRNSIGARQLRLMKPTAYFINVARGEIVDQAALLQALREKWFAGAGLDVFEHEPLPKDDPLVALDNVILTPHWLPSTRDAARLTMTTMAEGIIRASEGLVPDNVVNRAVIERPGFQAKLARFATS